MGRPQQPELARSAKTDLDPDHIGTGLEGHKPPTSGGPTGPVPAENQPGHHPAEEQDKPDLDAFAAKLSGQDRPQQATASDTAPPKAETTATTAGSGGKPDGPAKTGRVTKARSGTKATSATKTAPTTKTGRATKTSGARKTSAAPRRTASAVRPTPAKRPAAAPGWPESAPAAADPGPLGEPPAPAEPAYLGIVLFPLRATLKGLEWLERSLSGRSTDRDG